MKKLFLACAALIVSCAPTGTVPEDGWVDLSERQKPSVITQLPWQEVVIGVPDLDNVPRLFLDIGGFEKRYQGENSLVLGAPGVKGGLVRFEKTEADAIITRPFGSRSWDTGCYFSIMIRAKNLPSIITDAKKLGWVPLTEMAYLEFGPSQLNIVVLTHRDTGIQVQLYERLTTPLPDGFPDFDRLSRPFNMMQMVRDRDAAFTFFQQDLGFDTFYYGKPSLSKTPQVNPLGIPAELTTTVPYKAGIVTPRKGLEWGRVEMIEVMKMQDGKDYAAQCTRGNIGITSVRFEVEDITAAQAKLAKRGVDISDEVIRGQIEPYGIIDILNIKTPDGANIEFFEDKHAVRN